MDFETAAKLSGARFVLMSGTVAPHSPALAQFMINTHIDENGLTETWTPVLVRPEMMLGTGQLPKFGEDSYETTNGWWLVPTAEVTLTNIVNGMTVDEDYLPRRYVAHTQCFRSEAGSAGKDTAGMLRQHQFEKVEMVSVTHPDKSREELDRMTGCAQGILEKLGLPYRTVVLCVGDMGFGARRTHDIEVWLPGTEQVSRDQLGFGLRGFPGAAYECAVQGPRWRQTAIPAHAERLGPGGRPLPDRCAGKRPAGRRFRRPA